MLVRGCARVGRCFLPFLITHHPAQQYRGTDLISASMNSKSPVFVPSPAKPLLPVRTSTKALFLESLAMRRDDVVADSGGTLPTPGEHPFAAEIGRGLSILEGAGYCPPSIPL